MPTIIDMREIKAESTKQETELDPHFALILESQSHIPLSLELELAGPGGCRCQFTTPAPCVGAGVA